ncbi:MAG: hypothetical protein ACOX50_01500 [Patescibacteria group bacterium]|jgi:hypothetical protein
MAKKLVLALFIFIIPLISPKLTFASEIAGASGVLKTEAKVADTRVLRLEGYLKSQGSPLAPYAQKFVEEADKNQIDWRLLPAIAGIESSFGKKMIAGTHNAWGWGGEKIRFASWNEAIETISKALAEKYYARGLNTPEKINPVYCPPNRTWAPKVRAFMNKIESFEDANTQMALTL